MKKIAFRVDASKEIGAGHLMRCKTLASEIIKIGAEVIFLSRNMPQSYARLLDEAGIAHINLTSFSNEALSGRSPYDKWLGTSQRADSCECMLILNKIECDLLVVDHYSLDASWENRMRPFAKKIMVIDDLADRQHDCDFLLDQNYYVNMENRYREKVSIGCTLFLGPEFALLRSEFSKLHKNILPRTSVKNILVSLGGVDANNFTAVALQAISMFEDDKFNVDVVIGAEHPMPEKIFAICKRFKFKVHVQTGEMAQLMAQADLAIGASGATTWERCCLGLPSLVVTLAENQVQIARDIDSYGAALYIGSEDIVSAECIFKVIGTLIDNPNKVSKLSNSAYALVDGRGIARVLEKIGIMNEDFNSMH
jgi:UDP-2,4-diacetamido-2,4,6-trideoxy-beta-L-altropyranose hydrolase